MLYFHFSFSFFLYLRNSQVLKFDCNKSVLVILIFFILSEDLPSNFCNLYTKPRVYFNRICNVFLALPFLSERFAGFLTG